MTGKVDKKQKLIEECKKTQSKTVESAKAARDEAQQALNEYGPNKDRYDSFRDQLIHKRDMFSSQYSKALEKIKVLDKIRVNKPNDVVKFGSVVITDKQKLFVSISAGKITLDGEQYFAISPGVPLYKVMEGMNKGQEFHFNGQKHIIREIY